ncbi:hypothetical protein FACS1894172_08180 [Spirochaetia bacterium]|nr:hypothetical protein FACS1894164_07780 [Spirochaetia bacterium]GHU32121.1 hypothetical protein FACS1894172_08180 [Spirochaetia bacterium]
MYSLRKKDYEKALADCTEAINLDPSNTWFYATRGNAYISIQDYDKAIADLIKSVSLNPNYQYAKDRLVAAHHERAKDSFRKQDYDRTVGDCDELIGLKPDMVEAFFLRGRAYAKKGDWDKALADYNRIRLGLKYDPAHPGHSLAILSSEDRDKVLEDCNAVLETDPNIALAHALIGMYSNEGDWEKAITDCTEAIRLDINCADAFYYRAMRYGIREDYDRAIPDFERYLRLNPDDANAKEILAAVYTEHIKSCFKAEDLNQIINDCEALLKIKPDYADARHWLASCYSERSRGYLNQGDWNRAIADCGGDQCGTELCQCPCNPCFGVPW